MILTDHVFCVAVKEMEAWLLGDIEAIEKAYPKLKRMPQKIMFKTESQIHGKSLQTWFILEV